MKHRPTSLISNSRWLRGIEPLSSSTIENVPVEQQNNSKSTPKEQDFDPFADDDDNLVLCTTCNVALDPENREEFSEHYKSNWHRRNASRVTHGKQPLSEEVFEENIENGDDLSSLSESDNELDRTITSALGSSHEYFVQDEEVFSIYKCILHSSLPLDSQFFRFPIDCAIFMLAGGHFAAAVFSRGLMTHHKTINRYTVRAKQGGAQSANDCKGGPAHSAGAALRRYNERVLKSEIGQLIGLWAEPLRATPLVFIRCSSYQRQTFVGEGLFDKKDERLRTIPFETKRPTIEELKRAWEYLGSVFSHGNVEEFKEQLNRRCEAKKRSQAQRKKREKEVEEIIDSEEDERLDEEREKQREERQKRKALQELAEKEEKEALDPWIEIDKDWRSKLYTYVRNDDLQSFVSHVDSAPVSSELVREYIEKCAFPPDGSTVMHLCAKNGNVKILKHLLSERFSCSVKNAANFVPYQVAETKSIRAHFIDYRSQVGEDESIDWRATHIPMPVEKIEKDERELEIEKEKKKAKKDRQKDRQRAKKEEERIRAAEESARVEWLGLSDREKRARAAEARLSGMQSTVVSRCYQCASALSSKPFNYESFNFCSPNCVAEHRTSHAPQKVI